MNRKRIIPGMTDLGNPAEINMRFRIVNRLFLIIHQNIFHWYRPAAK